MAGRGSKRGVSVSVRRGNRGGLGGRALTGPGSRTQTTPRRGVPRALALAAVLGLVAAACSSGAATGTVGSALSANNGTVTLVKVISPAGVTAASPGRPKLGHQLVVVVLEVHNPTSSPAKFGGIYVASKLIDSHKLVHVGNSTARYAVPECAAYPVFGTVPADGSATGCDVFEISQAFQPAKLKISGKARAEWTIASSALTPGTPSALPATTTTAPGSSPTSLGALGASPTTSTTAGNGSTKAGNGSTKAGNGSTTTTSSVGPQSHVHHARKSPPRILRVVPMSASPGQMVRVVGRRLAGATSVLFNGTQATVTADRGHSLEALVPDGATTGPIEVITTAGTVSTTGSFVIE